MRLRVMCSWEMKNYLKALKKRAFSLSGMAAIRLSEIPPWSHVVIYGTGSQGRFVGSCLKKRGIGIDYSIDSFMEGTLFGMPIYRVEAVAETLKYQCLLITSYFNIDIAKRLGRFTTFV